jgi:hypothetical protein
MLVDVSKVVIIWSFCSFMMSLTISIDDDVDVLVRSFGCSRSRPPTFISLTTLLVGE